MNLPKKFRPIRAVLNEGNLTVLLLQEYPELRTELEHSIYSVSRELNLNLVLNSTPLEVIRSANKVNDIMEAKLSEPSIINEVSTHTKRLLDSFHSIYIALVSNVHPADVALYEFREAMECCLFLTATEYSCIMVALELPIIDSYLAASLISSILYRYESVFYTDKKFVLISVHHLKRVYDSMNEELTLTDIFKLMTLAIPTAIMYFDENKDYLLKLLIAFYSNELLPSNYAEQLNKFIDNLNTL